MPHSCLGSLVCHISIFVTDTSAMLYADKDIGK